MGISIIIPTFNGLANLQRLFASMEILDFVEGDQIVVVVNGSTDGSLEFVEATIRGSSVPMKLVELPYNKGFAGGVNAGLDIVPRGNDVVILNDDTVMVDPNVFGELRRVAYESERLGIVSPLILNQDGTLQTHGAGHLPFSLAGKAMAEGRRWVNQYAGLRDCEVVPFVCAFIKAACFADVGKMDETYFAYLEDSDYCLQARMQGWGVASWSGARVVHLGPGTTAYQVAPAGQLYRESLDIFRERWGNVLASRWDHDLVMVADVAPWTGYGTWARFAMRALLNSGVRTFYQPARRTAHEDRPALDLWVRDCQRHRGDPSMAQVIIEHANRFHRASGRLKIGWTMCEVQPWPDSWIEGLGWVDEAWVPTAWEAASLLDAGFDGNLQVMPLGVDPGIRHPGITPWPDRPPVDFLFVSCFMWAVRKNADMLITAFRDEFGPDESVALYIKTGTNRPGETLQYETRWWLREPAARVFVTQDFIHDAVMGGLYTMGDCFVLPSSGEGWCLPAMDALACGCPVITTDWSAPAEWGREEDGKPLAGMHFLGKDLVNVRTDIPIYRDAVWARPDYGDLRRLMRLAVEQRKEWKAAAREGSEMVRERYTWANVAERIRGRLDAWA